MTIILAFPYETAFSSGVKGFEDPAPSQVLSKRNPGPRQVLPFQSPKGFIDLLIPNLQPYP